jgi:phospholipase C
LNLRKSYNWYDFILSINGYPDFAKHYAGRVETGKSSYSDPAMG